MAVAHSSLAAPSVSVATSFAAQFQLVHATRDARGYRRVYNAPPCDLRTCKPPRRCSISKTARPHAPIHADATKTDTIISRPLTTGDVAALIVTILVWG